MDSLDPQPDQQPAEPTPETASVEPACLPARVAVPPACAAAGGQADDVADTSRAVIREERIKIKENPDSGESFILAPSGRKGCGRILSIPLPKQDGNPRAALTDFLNCTFPLALITESLSDLFQLILACLGRAFGPVVDRKRGLHGYRHSFAMGESGAIFAHGGQAETAFLSLPGESCAWITDWLALVSLFGDRLQGRITRWDGAVDVFSGSPSVDDAVALYQAGGFNTGGNLPSCSQAGNWLAPDGRGRTFYVGRRENGKVMRVYEKGMQLGDPENPWVRWELELHNKDRIIPWEVLLEPGKYVAGAYACMKWVQEDMCRIKTIKQANKISYAHLSRCLKNSYGQMLNTALKVEGGDAEKVIAKLRRPGTPSRLDPSQLPEPDKEDEE
jgi:phage replication initiation protein